MVLASIVNVDIDLDLRVFNMCVSMTCFLSFFKNLVALLHAAKSFADYAYSSDCVYN